MTKFLFPIVQLWEKKFKQIIKVLEGNDIKYAAIFDSFYNFI